MPDLIKNHTNILAAIEQAKIAASSDASVHLLAVSKQKSASSIAQLAAHGQRHFGENYLQEALEKQDELAQVEPKLDIVWHYIGHIQRNKTRQIAQHFDWVHTLERGVIAQRLAEQRPAHLPPLNVCIQVNIDTEASKSGCTPSEVLPLAMQTVALTKLNLRGLMVLPDPSRDTARSFAQTKSLFDDTKKALTEHGVDTSHFDTLSMGMSADFDQAIAYGATFVRVGSALFGARK